MQIGVIVPDPEANGIHIPFAKSQLRAFAAEWRGFYLSRVIKVGDVSITMEVLSADAGRVTITSPPPYMESGIMELLGTGLSAAHTYEPAIVKLTPRVAGTANAKSLPNAAGHKLSDGDETWTAAGCKPSSKLKLISVPGGAEGTKEIKRDEPTFCEPAKIQEHKLIRERIKPSLYTGKLQLYVQALYGSARTDFRADFSRDGKDGELSIFTGKSVPAPEGSLEPPKKIWVRLGFRTPTSGLLTVAPGHYLLVEVSSDGITYRKMVGGAGKPKTPESEAYLLSTLTPSSVVKTAEGSGLGEVVGIPLAYGWHFNKSGFSASMCTLKSQTISGTVARISAVNTIGGYMFARYQLGFQYDRDTGKLSYSVSKADEGIHIPYIWSKMFIPMPGKLGMGMLLPSAPGPYASVTIDSKAPVYCFYDATDQLIVVHAFNGTYSKIAANATPFDLHALPTETQNSGLIVFQTSACQGRHEARFRVSPDSWTSAPMGFSASDVSRVAINSVATGQTIDDTFVVQEGGEEKDYSYTVFGSDPPITTPYFAKTYSNYASYHHQTIQTDVSLLSSTFLAIPHDSASSAILGSRKRKTSVYEYEGYTRMALNKVWFWPPSPNIPPGTLPGPGVWSMGDLNHSLNPVTPDFKYSDEAKNNANYTDIAVDLVTWVGTIPLYGSRIIDLNRNGGLTNQGAYASFFDCSESDPIVPRVMQVCTSYFGSVRHDQCLPMNETPPKVTGYANGWPEYDNPGGGGLSTPVGWA